MVVHKNPAPLLTGQEREFKCVFFGWSDQPCLASTKLTWPPTLVFCSYSEFILFLLLVNSFPLGFSVFTLHHTSRTCPHCVKTEKHLLHWLLKKWGEGFFLQMGLGRHGGSGEDSTWDFCVGVGNEVLSTQVFLARRLFREQAPCEARLAPSWDGTRVAFGGILRRLASHLSQSESSRLGHRDDSRWLCVWSTHPTSGVTETTRGVSGGSEWRV